MSDKTIDVKKENRKLALSVYLRTILAAVLCILVYLSLSVIFTGMSTKTIGYTLYELDDSSNWVEKETHLYADESGTSSVSEAASTVSAASDTESDAESDSTEATSAVTEKQVPIQSEMPKSVSITLDILSEIFMLLLFIAFPYSILWSKGDRDKNSVNFGHMDEDKLRGLKVGLMAGIPAYIGYLGLLISKIGGVFPSYVVVYRFMNVPFMPIILNMMGKNVFITSNVSWFAIVGMLLLLAVLPLICHVAYMLGYKQISLTEKFIYVNPNKKKKRRRY